MTRARAALACMAIGAGLLAPAQLASAAPARPAGSLAPRAVWLCNHSGKGLCLDTQGSRTGAGTLADVRPAGQSLRVVLDPFGPVHTGYPFTGIHGWNDALSGRQIVQIESGGNHNQCYTFAGVSRLVRLHFCSTGGNGSLWVIKGGYFINVAATDLLSPKGQPAVLQSACGFSGDLAGVVTDPAGYLACQVNWRPRA